MAEISIENLSFYYAGQEQPALKDISLHIRQGEFVVLIGSSGSGKSTLLRQLKPILTPKGTQSGMIKLDEQPIGQLNAKEQAEKIGFLLQTPEHQLVAEEVWQELAFGLENLGYHTETIRMRVAEMANYFGIQHWFDRSVSELSGGQKQLLNLAAILALHPDVLLLDEPLSQLDPIAAENFLITLRKINRDLGVTIVLSEHRLEQVLPEADRVIVLDGGSVFCDGEPAKVAECLVKVQHPMFDSMPTPARLAAALGFEEYPLTVRQGRAWVQTLSLAGEMTAPNKKSVGEKMVEAKRVYMRYEKNRQDVLQELDITLHTGELYALLGGNGSGKSTLLQVLCGIRKPYAGKIKQHKGIKIAMLPQDVQTLFGKETVQEELEEITTDTEKLQQISKVWKLEQVLTQHPYDISGGEQQRLAMAKLWLLDADVLLLDEPTKGMEQTFKRHLAQIFAEAKTQGKCILMASHDIEFCAEYADRCGMLFRGELTAEGPAGTLFEKHMFYTTSVNRMVRNICPQAVTIRDLLALRG